MMTEEDRAADHRRGEASRTPLPTKGKAAENRAAEDGQKKPLSPQAVMPSWFTNWPNFATFEMG